MSRPCSVCQSEHRAAIDEALIAGEPIRRIAAHSGASETALRRHRDRHIPATLARAKQVEERARTTALQAQADRQDAAADAQALDAMGELRQLFATVHKLRSACDDWLTDPADPTRYTLEPRADDVQVVYWEADPDGRRRRRKAPASVLLARLAVSGLEVERWETRHADPRKLLLDAAGQLGEQIGLLHKLVELADLEARVGELEAHIAGRGERRRGA